jgi:hypothetical protein
LQEKTNLVMLATLKQVADPGVASRAMSLFLRKALPDSAYYDLWPELEAMGRGHRLEQQALLKRIELGDETVWLRVAELGQSDPEFQKVVMPVLLKRLSRGNKLALPIAFKIARDDPEMMAPVIGHLPRFGEDAMTTLCLIAEGKYLPGSEKAAFDTICGMPPCPHPATLPALIKALDDPRVGIRYRAYTEIESARWTYLRYQWPVPSTLEFQPDSRGGWDFAAPPTARARQYCNRMKTWWDAEGEEQFESVARKMAARE